MNAVFLGLGGNIGDRLENLRRMRAALAESCGRIVKTSGIYETEAWGSDSKNNYLNQVVKLLTPHSPEALLRRLLAIEQELKRERIYQNADRTADMDILFYGNTILHTDGLNIPHPRLHLRKFVLIPLCEIDPELMHPEHKQTVQELLDCCTDPLQVERIPVPEN